MKFLIVVVAIISGHWIWGAFPDADQTGQFEAGSSCTQDGHSNTPFLGASLNSPEEQSPDASTDRSSSAASTYVLREGRSPQTGVVTPQHSGGCPTPQAAGVSPAPDEVVSPPAEPAHAAVDPGQVSPLHTGSYMELLPCPIFSKTTHDLLVLGKIVIGESSWFVRSQGKMTPCLDYILGITPACLEKVVELYCALTDCMNDVVADFIADCRIVNPTLHLSREQAEVILEAVRMDLFHIRFNFLKDSKPG
jgi:hypothetical protein